MARGEPDVLQRGREEVDMLRRRVLNVVGHELRTPVTTLRGLAEALEVAGTDLERAQVTDALVRSAHRLESLVDDALVAMGVTTALPVGAPRAESVAEALQAAWREAGADGELFQVGDRDAKAWVPPGTLTPALTRVLHNHLRYGDGPIEVAVVVVGDADRIEVRISSAGPDLPDADLALAAEAFYRGELAVTTTPGLGLGLSVARALVEHAGGSLHLARREGGGTMTVVEVPA